MTHDASRPPEQIAAFDLLMHRGEANPRTRSAILGVEILDSTPAWDRYVSTFEYASRRVLRLRQKIVVPTLPTAAPRWVVDPISISASMCAACVSPNPPRCVRCLIWPN